MKTLSKAPARGTAVELWPAREGRPAMLLKREDQNPTGSHKDRAAQHQVRVQAERGVSGFVLSSSGNAAIAAARAARLGGLPLYAFLSRRTPASKVRAVLSEGGVAILSRKPVNLARYVARRYGLADLRPSRCPLAVDGFEQSLGEEVAERYRSRGDFDAVFIFSSSGASLIAVARRLGSLFPAPSLHAVQAGERCAIAERFDPEPERLGAAPRTGALGGSGAERAEEAIALLQGLGGGGWIVRDDEVDRAAADLAASGLSIAREGAAAVAAAERAWALGRSERPLVILTGRAHDPEPCGEDEPGVDRLDDYLEAKAFFDREAERW